MKKKFVAAALAALSIVIEYGGQNTMAQTAQKNTTKDPVVTRTFDAPVGEVWSQWSDSDKVMKWWGPQGFTAPVARIDFREGGTSLVCMRAPKEFGGQNIYNTWTYRKIVPMKEIEFVLHFADKDGKQIDPASIGLPADIPHGVRHVITFKSIGNKTEITVTEYGYTSDQTLELSRLGLEECLDKMADSLKK